MTLTPINEGCKQRRANLINIEPSRLINLSLNRMSNYLAGRDLPRSYCLINFVRKLFSGETSSTI